MEETLESRSLLDGYAVAMIDLTGKEKKRPMRDVVSTVWAFR